MKKLISILLLSGSLILTGCGSSTDNVNPIGGQQPGIVNPTPPVGIAGVFVDGASGNDATAAAAATANNATDLTPFKTISAAVTAAGTNKTITVKPGTYNEAVTLLAGQKLLGTLGQAKPVLSQTLTLADGNTVDGLEFDGVAGNAVVANGVTDGTIINCGFENVTVGAPTTGSAIDIVDGGGTWSVESNVFNNIATIAVVVQNNGTSSLTAYVNSNQFTTNAGSIGFRTQDTAQILTQVHSNTMTGSGMEIIAGGASFGLDLEDNTTDGDYALFLSPSGTGTFSVEQLSTLTAPKPGGAGNTGTVDTTASAPLTEVANGSLGL